MTESQVVITVRSDSHPALAFISGGGGGHEPLDSGFVAPGMLHACVTGPRFTSPSAPDIAQLMEEVTAELGVNTIVALVKNYTGDVMNFELAAELAAASGLECIMIRVCDDCAT